MEADGYGPGGMSSGSLRPAARATAAPGVQGCLDFDGARQRRLPNQRAPEGRQLGFLAQALQEKVS